MDVWLTKEVSEWLLQQGAEVHIPDPPREYIQGKWTELDPVVMFGGRKIHFYAGGSKAIREARIFFNEDNQGSALLLLMKWPNSIFKHNIPNTIK